MPRQIIPTALLTEDRLGLIGDAIARVSPIGDAPELEALLVEIDEAERRSEGVEGKGQELVRKAVTD